MTHAIIFLTLFIIFLFHDQLFSRVLYVTVSPYGLYLYIHTFRHPNELGGMYWSANILISMGLSYAAFFMYYRGKVASEEIAREEEKFLALVNATMGSVLVIFVCFLKLMKKKYTKTFFSLQTSNEYSKNFFLKGYNDENKLVILTVNRRKWKEIREEVANFIKVNWAKWEIEKPVWFDEQFKASVDDDLLPAETLRAMVLGGSGNRRRSSMYELLERKLFRAERVGETASSVGVISGAASTVDAMQRMSSTRGRLNSPLYSFGKNNQSVAPVD